LEQGLERGRNAIARAALAKGLSINLIKEITGLDADTIRRLQEEN
jgi:ribosomal protein S11